MILSLKYWLLTRDQNETAESWMRIKTSERHEEKGKGTIY